MLIERPGSARSGHASQWFVSFKTTAKFMRSTQLFILSLLTLYGGFANASSDPQLYTLKWQAKGEQLTYRSCGCAGACWIVELRTGNRKRLKAKLRCDCSSLYMTYPVNAAELKRAESCPMNDAPDKMAEISKDMKAVVEGGPKSRK
jgi:hypothetical protein